MKTLNLVNPDASRINYKKLPFPDGQQNIIITSSISESVQIKSRLNNWLDLELISCAVASLREIDRDMEIHLYTPYIMGARSDRKFEEGGNNYLKDVICPIINSLNFKTVTCIDPHSDVLEACIKGFRKQIPLDLIKTAISSIYEKNPEEGRWYYKENLDKFILVSPDAGASKKIYKLADQIGYKGDIITCSKDRDAEGKLTQTIVPLGIQHFSLSKNFIIIDDICDGGRTFINIAKEIKEFNNKAKIYLIVTHGIFSKGLVELGNYFDGIYTTNSYSDWDKLRPSSIVLKQINIF